MKRIASLFLAFSLIAGVVAPVAAAPCKDAKGRFIKCPPPKAVPCKDKFGKFTSCRAPGAKPIR